MTALVTKHLPLVARAPDGVNKLRALILELAVQGRLTSQLECDEPALTLLGKASEEKVRSSAKGSARNASSQETAAPPFDVPKGWIWTKKSEVLRFLNGYAFKSEWFTSDGIRLLRNVNIGHGLVDWAESARVSKERATEFDAFALRAGDVVLTLDRPIISTGLKVAVIRDEDLPCLLLQRVAKISAYAGCVATEYLSVWLNSSYFIGAIDPGRSNGVPHISTTQVGSMLFALPPLAEQHRIVAKVDELMALCDRLEADQADAEAAHAQLVQALLGSLTQATDAADFRASWQRLSKHFHTLFTTEASIDALKQTVLQLAVMGKLVPQSFLDEPASDLLSRARAATVKAAKAGSGATPLPVDLPFELPSGWAWARFNDLITPEFPIAYGVLVPGPDSVDGVPFVRIADLDLVAPRPLPEKRISPEVDAQFARTRLRGGEILMGVVGSIGKLGLAPASWAGANIARAVCRIVPTSAVSTPYVLWLLQTQFMKHQFLGDTRTLAQPTLNVGLIRDALTPVPPLAEQHRIVAKVDELMALCDLLKAQLQQARQQHAQLARVLVEQAVAA